MKPLSSVEDWQAGGFGLYIHWPFCQSKCPYCDFNSHVSSSIDQDQWKAAYLSEIKRIGQQTPDRTLQSIFFGGGTPSLMDPDLVASILETVRGTWQPANDIEITMEANPSSVEAGRFRAYRDAGVNRVSIGVQALNDFDLRRLGRMHSVTEAKAAIETAKATFDRFSFDLIYARQDQSLKDWQAELTEAIAMAGDHLSLYQLTIEDGTVFGDRFRRGLLRGLPNDDLGADMYLATQELTEAAGFGSYEVSNYARSGHESRHNTIYWNAGDYAGIGPGAHGRLTLAGHRYATEAASNPALWLNGVLQGEGSEKHDLLSEQEQGLEYLMMGLRRDVGIDLDRYERICHIPLDEKKIETLQDLGMIQQKNRHLIATTKGRLLLNAVIEDLMPQ
ncbi:coproporphyrinogen III oxidase [Pseudorhodobacter turbinis]|uniref:Heme chaperone HemW n=1 Tax=Pseudorhodobacter turbinis TaxID=2500533 RepID=A0A4P8EGF0_9RHOB|nr:radical SAM family heme chaperone HemW [Pseudorhodobacter turbinis]QCO55802.1 coproporphyrinogen III oxidase [Pseudorhodobacter turbinis]